MRYRWSDLVIFVQDNDEKRIHPLPSQQPSGRPIHVCMVNGRCAVAVRWAKQLERLLVQSDRLLSVLILTIAVLTCTFLSEYHTNLTSQRPRSGRPGDEDRKLRYGFSKLSLSYPSRQKREVARGCGKNRCLDNFIIPCIHIVRHIYGSTWKC